MSSYVIIVNGLPRVGKDTAVEFMAEEAMRQRYAVRIISAIDCVREALGKAGIDVSKKTDADRKLLSIVGDALEDHSQFKSRAVLMSGWDHFRMIDKAVGFIFIREPDMVRKIREGFGTSKQVVTLLITGPRGVTTHNRADLSVNLQDYDYRLKNVGNLETYRTDCNDMFNTITKKELRDG